MELFHSKFYVPLGEPAPWYERNSFRYQNPEYDAIVDEMLVALGENADEATLVDIFSQAMEIWYEDLPVTPLTQAPALVPFNYTYWEGWPNAENPVDDARQLVGDHESAADRLRVAGDR